MIIVFHNLENLLDEIYCIEFLYVCSLKICVDSTEINQILEIIGSSSQFTINHSQETINGFDIFLFSSIFVDPSKIDQTHSDL